MLVPPVVPVRSTTWSSCGGRSGEASVRVRLRSLSVVTAQATKATHFGLEEPLNEPGATTTMPAATPLKRECIVGTKRRWLKRKEGKVGGSSTETLVTQNVGHSGGVRPCVFCVLICTSPPPPPPPLSPTTHHRPHQPTTLPEPSQAWSSAHTRLRGWLDEKLGLSGCRRAWGAWAAPVSPRPPKKTTAVEPGDPTPHRTEAR